MHQNLTCKFSSSKDLLTSLYSEQYQVLNLGEKASKSKKNLEPGHSKPVHPEEILILDFGIRCGSVLRCNGKSTRSYYIRPFR